MDARPAGGVYCNFRGACVDSIPLQRHIYRAAYGRKLGRAGGCVSGAISIRIILEADDKGGLLGELYFLHGCDAGQHFLTFLFPGFSAVPD